MSLPLTTASGRQVDLYRPERGSISFNDIAEHLSKVARYNGATPDAIYFVAQHLCLGADEIRFGQAAAGMEFDRDFLAAYFLCHDFHEAFLGDDTTPKKRGLDRVLAELGIASGAASDAFARQTERFDAAIHAGAGLAWPPPKDVEAFVHLVDRRMLVTEWRDLMPGKPLPAGCEDIAPFDFEIAPWDWRTCRTGLLERMRELLPNFREA